MSTNIQFSKKSIKKHGVRLLIIVFVHCCFACGSLKGVLQEAERTLAEAGGDQITLHSDGVSEDIDIQDLLG